MFKVIVNISGKRARVVPGSYKPTTVERQLAEISTEDALANRDSLDDAVRGLLEAKGITDAKLYAVELPDNLKPVNTLAPDYDADSEATADKRTVIKAKRVTAPKPVETPEPEQEPEPVVEQPVEVENAEKN